MNRMKIFKKLNGKCYFGVSIIVDKHNSLYVYELIERLKDIGVDSVKVSPCIVSNRGSYNKFSMLLVLEKMGAARKLLLC